MVLLLYQSTKTLNGNSGGASGADKRERSNDQKCNISQSNIENREKNIKWKRNHVSKCTCVGEQKDSYLLLNSKRKSSSHSPSQMFADPLNLHLHDYLLTTSIEQVQLLDIDRTEAPISLSNSNLILHAGIEGLDGHSTRTESIK